jgi:hypothetical protein
MSQDADFGNHLWRILPMRKLLLFVFFLFLAEPAQADSYRIVSAGSVSVPHPAFQVLDLPQQPGAAVPLLISSFQLTGSDGIYRIADPAAVLQGHGKRPELVTDAVLWPNEVQPLDASIFGEAGLLIPSGFMVPLKSTGALSFLDSGGLLTKITEDKFGYFYHRALPVDLTGSGHADILTARAFIPPVGPADGELVLLRRPQHPLEQVWPDLVLAKGPDIHFRVAKNPADGSLVVVTAEFSRRCVALYWLERGAVQSRVIDNTLGAAFDLEFADLNNDGELDLLVTKHESKAEKSAVYAYSLPHDYKTGPWVRHILLSNIETRQKGIGAASPGAAKAFYPEVGNPGGKKPWIVVSGDGSQRVHLLRPQSEDSADWNYAETILLDSDSTVGEPLVADFDHDGFADIAVPLYDDNLVRFFSVKKDL